MVSQPLQGLIGQAMDGRKKVITPSTYLFPPGSYTFSPPDPGVWKFVLWGPGGNGSGSGTGSSGGYCEYSLSLGVRDRVTLSVGLPAIGTTSTATTATFPGGKVVSAGPGAQGAGGGGVATGGDLNIAGSDGSDGSIVGPAGGGTGGGPGGVAGVGAGAPAALPFRGGGGGAANSTGYAPGGGAGFGPTQGNGAGGLIIAMRVR